MALLRSFNGQDGGPGENPALRTAFLAQMELSAPILNYAEFYAIQGNADTLQVANEFASQGEQRALNADFSTRAQSTSNEATTTLRISGDEIETDQALERRGLAVEGIRLRDLKSAAKSFGRYMMDQFVNGDGTGQNVTGIATHITAGQTITFSSANGGQIPFGNSDANVALQEEFVATLDELVESVIDGAGVLIMDAQVVARLKGWARGILNVTTIQDAYGRAQQITSYGGVPIVRAGFAADGTTRVLPFTETVGASSDCSSVYAVRFGEREMLTLPTSVGLVVKDKGLEGSHYVTQYELDWNVAIENAKAIAKIEGVRL